MPAHSVSSQVFGDLNEVVESTVSLEDATNLAAAGVTELNLIAMDSTAYDFDLKPRQSLTTYLTILRLLMAFARYESCMPTRAAFQTNSST